MFSALPALGLATTFALSLICGCVGVACGFRLALDVLVVAAGESLASEDDASYWTWPRDRRKLTARMALLTMGAVFCVILSYWLASQVFAHR
jgi:hypothetical protein